MTAEEIVLLKLIRLSLFQNDEPLVEDTDWDAVICEAKKQAIAGLITYALPNDIKTRYCDYFYQSIAQHARYLHAQDELIQMFSAAEIPLVILKGCAAAVYYSVPSLRAMGDVDFLVPQDCFEKSLVLMENGGYIPSHAEQNAGIRHVTFSKNGITFELHHHFSNDELDIEPYLVEGIRHAETATIENYSFPVLPPLLNGLVLLVHMRSHLRSGLGLRQVIDWMMYVDSVLDDDFWYSSFRKIAVATGLDTLAVTSTRTCQLFLGLDERITWSNNADDDLCRRLMDDLLLSGNFGTKQGIGNKVITTCSEIRRRGTFRYLQFAGEYNWKAYKRHPWLKPFCWLYQAFRYCRQWFQIKRGKKLKYDLKRSNERYDLLKELNIV